MSSVKFEKTCSRVSIIMSIDGNIGFCQGEEQVPLYEVTLTGDFHTMWLTPVLCATVRREFNRCHHPTLCLAFSIALFLMASCV